MCLCPELQRRRTGEHLQGFKIHRRSAPPPSQPLLHLRLDKLPSPLKDSLRIVWLFFNFQALSIFPLFLHFYLLCLLPQCVCTLSPSPSKQSKPTPLDSLQLPLAPGFVTHTVSLYWPLITETIIHHQGFLSALWGISIADLTFSCQSDEFFCWSVNVRVITQFALQRTWKTRSQTIAVQNPA